ncbi:hypothetical protein CYMTET_44474 [Cymbomonas tetramitiformis]|uniref:Uncharacterized protein n=1 Tax=Cymbomonas tetramitiformis TaxID=36881 RepID=A0AAE0EZK3_9CHLO|nr:hypothetical protein CYMTET_44474 [Cymbomonas tetramitiformis]
MPKHPSSALKSWLPKVEEPKVVGIQRVRAEVRARIKGLGYNRLSQYEKIFQPRTINPSQQVDQSLPLIANAAVRENSYAEARGIAGGDRSGPPENWPRPDSSEVKREVLRSRERYSPRWRVTASENLEAHDTAWGQPTTSALRAPLDPLTSRPRQTPRGQSREERQSRDERGCFLPDLQEDHVQPADEWPEDKATKFVAATLDIDKSPGDRGWSTNQISVQRIARPEKPVLRKQLKNGDRPWTLGSVQGR